MGNKGRGEKTKMNKGRREGQGERANNNKEFSYVFVWCLFRSLIGPKSGQNPKKKKHPNLQPHFFLFCFVLFLFLFFLFLVKQIEMDDVLSFEQECYQVFSLSFLLPLSFPGKFISFFSFFFLFFCSEWS